MAKVCFTSGYQCFLTITERTKIKYYLKNGMKELTGYTKAENSWKLKRRYINQKKGLAKILSKIERLFPLEEI